MGIWFSFRTQTLPFMQPKSGLSFLGRPATFGSLLGLSLLAEESLKATVSINQLIYDLRSYTYGHELCEVTKRMRLSAQVAENGFLS